MMANVLETIPQDLSTSWNMDQSLAWKDSQMVNNSFPRTVNQPLLDPTNYQISSEEPTPNLDLANYQISYEEPTPNLDLTSSPTSNELTMPDLNTAHYPISNEFPTPCLVSANTKDTELPTSSLDLNNCSNDNYLTSNQSSIKLTWTPEQLSTKNDNMLITTTMKDHNYSLNSMLPNNHNDIKPYKIDPEYEEKIFDPSINPTTMNDCEKMIIDCDPMLLDIKQEADPLSMNSILEEDSIIATSHDPNLFQFGELTYNVKESNQVKLSKATGFHVVRESAMNIKVTIPMTDKKECFVRATLVRKNYDQRHHIINQVCHKHINDSEPYLQSHVLQTSTNPNLCWYDSSGIRKSVCFWLYKNEKQNILEALLSLKFICLSTCTVTRNYPLSPERGREWFLVLTVESKECQRIFARSILNVWPKSTINTRDMCKPRRMEVKGGAAQLILATSKNKMSVLQHKVSQLVTTAKKHDINKGDLMKFIDEHWEEINPTLLL